MLVGPMKCLSRTTVVMTCILWLTTVLHASKYGRLGEPVPEAAQILFKEALGMQAQGDLKEALRRFEAALKVTDTIAPEVMYNVGNVLREMGKKKEASESYIEALRHRPLYPKAIFNLAAMAQAGKNNAAAAQFFKLFLSVEKEVSADPKSIGYSLQMGPRAVASAH